MDDMDDFGDLYGDLDLRFRDRSINKEDDNIDSKIDSPTGKEMVSLEEEDMNVSDSDDDDFRIVLNNDEKPTGGANGSEEVEDEGDRSKLKQVMEDESDVRGIEGNGGFGGQRRGWHTGAHSVRFSNGLRPSVSERGDYQRRPCFQSTTSYNVEISAAAQHGGGFFLPRNRTIFDINIEAFEQKPWRLHGANITDYFNFGLDEESWKNYCGSLDYLRQQANMSNRIPSCISSRLNQGERYPSLEESLEQRGWGFDMPKGRAIEVEDGLGERIPSTDLRRPRLLDSDVVIEIPMDGSPEDACKNSLEHAEHHIDTSLSVSDDNSKERAITNAFVQAELKNGDFKVTSLEKYNCNKDDQEVPLRYDFDNQDSHGFSSYGLQSHSEEFKDTLSMVRDVMPIKKESVTGLQGSVESDYYLSNDSLSDTIKSEEDDGKDDVYEQNLSSGEEHFNRTRHRSVTKDDELASSQHRRNTNSNKYLHDSRFEKRKRKSSYDADFRGPYYETELSLNYKRRTYSQKGDYSKERVCSISERYHDDGSTRNSVRKYSEYRVTENRSFFKARNLGLCLAKNRDDEHLFRMETEFGDDRYRERVVQDIHGRHRAFYDSEEDFDHKYGRLSYPTDGEKRTPKRSRYKTMPNDELNMSGKCRYNDAKNILHLDRRLGSHRYEETSILEGKNSYDVFSPRGHLHLSLRTKARNFNHRGHLNVRELQFSSKRHGHFAPSIKNKPDISYEAILEPEVDENVSEGDLYCDNDVSNFQMKRCKHPPKIDLHTDDNDNARFSYYKQGKLSSREKSVWERTSICDRFQANQPSFRGQTFRGARQLNNARKVTVVGSCDSESRNHDMGKHKVAAIGCSETVNKQLKGLNGKLSRKFSGVAVESKKIVDNKHKNCRHPTTSYKPAESLPQILSGEGSLSHRVGLKAKENRESKPINSSNRCKIEANYNDIEEGELIEESDKQKVTSGRKVDKFPEEDSSRNKKVVGIYNNHHILETLAKMEKRKERFKEPVGIKQGPEKSTDAEADTSVVLMDEVKQQRPARKRRWGGN